MIINLMETIKTVQGDVVYKTDPLTQKEDLTTPLTTGWALVEALSFQCEDERKTISSNEIMRRDKLAREVYISEDIDLTNEDIIVVTKNLKERFLGASTIQAHLLNALEKKEDDK